MILIIGTIHVRHAEFQQQSKGNHPSSINSLTEQDKQPTPATEYSACTIDSDISHREVMNPATTTQAPDSPVDQELPDYFNVDAINMHVDGLTV